MKIEVSEEDYNFLKDLQNEPYFAYLKANVEFHTQETDGNAQPVYWGVLETKEVGVPDECGEPRIYRGDGYCGTLEDAVMRIDESIRDYSEETQKVWHEIDKNNMLDVVEFAKSYLDWREWRIVYVENVNSLAENTGPFLTKRACKDYIKKVGYHFSDPHTYAMTALRNKEFEKVVNILRTMKL